MNFELPGNPNAAYSNEEGTMIDCDLVVNGETLRFTASANDPHDHGREIFEALKASKHKIAPYKAPAPMPQRPAPAAE